MRSFLAIACLALLGATLAGCSGDPERYPDGVAHTSTSRSATETTTGAATTTTSATTPTTGGPGNQPPTGSLSVAVNGTNATFTLQGSDPENETIVWDLDFGDGNSTNGTTLPAVVNHTYVLGNSTGNATGNNSMVNFTAIFTITDGRDPVTYNATISVGASGPTAPTVLTGEVTVPGTPLTSGALGANGCAGFNAGMSGRDCVFFGLEPAFEGRHYLAEGTGINLDLEIWATCDAAPPSVIEGGSLDSTIPAGAGCMILWFYSAGSVGTITVTIG
jgi:hypothetical protein